jgi:hypothetical protein
MKPVYVIERLVSGTWVEENTARTLTVAKKKARALISRGDAYESRVVVDGTRKALVVYKEKR